MIFQNFPYTNFHGLNLDWIIKAIKNVGSGTADLTKNLADEIANRENGDAALDKKIDDEAVARSNADENINKSIADANRIINGLSGDIDENAGEIATIKTDYMPKSGGTFTDSVTFNKGIVISRDSTVGISAGNKKIVSVALPTNNYDAANKQYVDSRLPQFVTQIVQRCPASVTSIGADFVEVTITKTGESWSTLANNMFLFDITSEKKPDDNAEIYLIINSGADNELKIYDKDTGNLRTAKGSDLFLGVFGVIYVHYLNGIYTPILICHR